MQTVVAQAAKRPLGQSATWRDLEVHSQDIRNRRLQALFTADPDRGQRMMAERAGVYLDYSKNRTTGQTMELLLELARGPVCMHTSRCSAVRRLTGPKTVQCFMSRCIFIGYVRSLRLKRRLLAHRYQH